MKKSLRKKVIASTFHNRIRKHFNKIENFYAEYGVIVLRSDTKRLQSLRCLFWLNFGQSCQIK